MAAVPEKLLQLWADMQQLNAPEEQTTLRGIGQVALGQVEAQDEEPQDGGYGRPDGDRRRSSDSTVHYLRILQQKLVQRLHF
ncbi:hypothetical protein EYF80_002005 [Liparis tanakae]|uniref:Uncharacterized protein n=1 Tax=Liparis tanakae TaxID=230148 RepID=A0A4Z2JDC8_9TELE|nr:hypothetical protein EYF80_002005 [Liparis tanakae]